MLNEIGHIALIVGDPVRTAAFFAELFAAEVVRKDDEDGHDETLVRLGKTWFVLVKAEVERPLTGDHIAFRVTPDDLRAAADRLTGMGHAFQMARSDTALYFTDFDNHVFELDTTDP